MRLADHFTGQFDWVTGGRWAAEQYGWSRINDHEHSFYRSSPETRTAVLVRDGDDTTVIGGFHGLTVLKTTQSGFVGYPKDEYTTLQETEDRILATDIATRWRYNTTDVDFNAVYGSVKDTLLTTFTQGYSKALQHTLYQMAEAVISGARHHRRDQVLLPQQAPLHLRPVLLRPGQPQRGLLRRGPALRAHRGHGPTRREPDRRRGVDGHRRLLLTVTSMCTRPTSEP